MTFRVGQEVVCVDDGNAHLGAIMRGLRSGLVVNRIYSVLSVHPDGDAVIVVECAPPEPCNWFRAELFRPVQKRKTDISVFTALLNTNKVLTSCDL